MGAIESLIGRYQRVLLVLIFLATAAPFSPAPLYGFVVGWSTSIQNVQRYMGAPGVTESLSTIYTLFTATRDVNTGRFQCSVNGTNPPGTTTLTLIKNNTTTITSCTVGVVPGVTTCGSNTGTSLVQGESLQMKEVGTLAQTNAYVNCTLEITL